LFGELYFLIFPLALELSTLAPPALEMAAVRFSVLAFAPRRGVVTLLPGAAVVGLVVLRSNVNVLSREFEFFISYFKVDLSDEPIDLRPYP
jgi:hypothetical protein